MTVHTIPKSTNPTPLSESSVLQNLATKLKFSFDLLDHVQSIKSENMRATLLNSLAWSADALIAAKLNALLLSYYRGGAPVIGDTPAWDTYQEFLGYVSTLQLDHDLLTSMGIDAVDNAHTLQKLYSIRMECHRLMADGKSDYETPHLEAFITTPRLREADGDTLVKWEDLTDDEVADIKDPNERAEMKKELLASYRMKHKADSLMALEWDQRRGQAAMLLLRAFKLTDAERDVSYDDEHRPFEQLDAATQYKLMAGAMRAIDRFIGRAATSSKINALEFGKLRVERKAYVKTLDAAMAHDRFTAMH